MLNMTPYALIELLVSPVYSISVMNTFLKMKLVSTIISETKLATTPHPITALVSYAYFSQILYLNYLPSLSKT